MVWGHGDSVPGEHSRGPRPGMALGTHRRRRRCRDRLKLVGSHVTTGAGWQARSTAGPVHSIQKGRDLSGGSSLSHSLQPTAPR